MGLQSVINKQRQRRRFRVRNKVRGTADRPRLSVQRSGRHISAQIIDDEQGRTLVAASTQQADIKSQLQSTSSVDAAKLIGKLIAERGQASGITKIAFDRGHYRYHGRIAALANSAREAGLQF